MKIPEGKTEAEVLEAIERTVNLLSPTFVMGYYDLDDIKQFARMTAIELMNTGKYDPTKPLDNFLYTHLKRRLINLRRNLLTRSDPPCKKCHSGQHCTLGGCQKYESWRRRNSAKANLMRPGEVQDAHVSRMGVDAALRLDYQFLMEKVDLNLPAELRSLWRQVLDGAKVPKAKREMLSRVVQTILEVNPQGEGDDE